MARLTTEDCIDKVNNRFELVALASQRAKMINSGSMITVDRDNDKDTVIALREIAEGNVKPSELKAAIIKSYQVKGKNIIEEVETDSVENSDSLTYLPDNLDLYVNQEDDLIEESYEDGIEHDI